MPQQPNSITVRLTPRLLERLLRRVTSEGTNQHAVLLAAVHVGLGASDEDFKAGATAMEAERVASDRRRKRIA